MIFPGFIIHIYIVTAFTFFGNDREQVTTDRFFPFDLTINISLFDPAFHDPVFILNAIDTYPAVNGWCYPPEFLIINIPALSLQFFFAFIV